MSIELLKLEQKHLEQVREWRNSTFVSQYMYTDAYISKQQQEKWFERISAQSDNFFWIIQYDGSPVGLASITNIDLQNRKCFWAFYLGTEEMQGVGIGSFVEYKVLEYAFNILNMNKVVGEVMKFNERVIKMHQRFGFQIEGQYRQHVFKNGGFEDVIGLALLREDWIQKRDSIKKLLKIN